MKLSDVFKIFKRNFLILMFFPMLLAALVLYKTKDEEKEYASNFLVYTGIASGYNITTEEHPRIDHNAVNNAFDNLLTTLKARETIEEVGIRLLASHILLDKPNAKIISTKNFYRLKGLMPDSIEKRAREAKTFEGAVDILYQYLNSPGNNAIKNFINSPFEVYGVDHISGKLIAKRKDLSDMLEVSYSANDPGICQQTLQILSDVFIRRYKELKRGEILNVVSYFEDQTQKSLEKLRSAEESLKRFEIENKIINFDEQTKSVSASKQTLMDNIENERLLKSAAESKVRNLESRLDLQKGLIETNKKILEKRKKLAELNYKLVNSKLYKPAELVEIRSEADALKEDIRLIVNDLYNLNTSTEGLPRNDLLTQWLNNVLIVDESTVRLQLLQDQLKEYDSMYNKYAPMGAALNRLKREIEVSEKEYMASLNAYNVNKQRQQNIEMTTTIRIVDKPFFPVSPKPSKRIVLVAGSFCAGFVLLFSTLFAIDFFDRRIKSPARAESLIGLKVAGALPFVRRRERRFDEDYLESSLMEQAVSSLVLEMRQRGGDQDRTKFLMISSARPDEGKTWSAFKLASKLNEISGKVLFLYPNYTKIRINSMKEYLLLDPGLDMKTYAVSKDFLARTSPEDLLGRNIQFDKYEYVLIEIPALSENQLPVDLVQKMAMSILVVDAQRKWTETDAYVTRLFVKASPEEPMVILNKVSPEGLKEIFGNIPKRKRKKDKWKSTDVSNDIQGKSVEV